MSTVMRGIFPVLQTAVGSDGDLDEPRLRQQVDFCIEAGAHGLVYPVLGSEFQYLSQDQRHQMAGAVVDQAAGRIPVVVGVAGTSQADALEHARHAATTAADAVIALPPYIANGTPGQVEDYYRAIAAAVEVPVFIQHTSGGISVDLMRRLFAEVDNISYLKEEMAPSAHQISAVVDQVGDDCLGIFGGGFGRWMLSELDRGATGFMPGAESVDVHVQIWDAYQAGDKRRARDLYNQLLPLLNLCLSLGIPLCKEVLVRRGVFSSAKMLTPGAQTLDGADHRELDIIMDDLRPLFKV